MQARLEKLETFAEETRDRLARIESKLDDMPRVFASKADLHEALHSLTWKLIGVSGALVAAVYFIARNVH